MKKKGFLNNGSIPGTPYSIKENLGWLRRVLTGPNTNNNNNVEYIPKKSVLNNIKPKYTISFIGDIMDINSKDLIIGDSIKNFVKSSDFTMKDTPVKYALHFTGQAKSTKDYKK